VADREADQGHPGLGQVQSWGAPASVGRDEDGSFRTFKSKVYPASMCKAIALCFRDALAQCGDKGGESGSTALVHQLPPELLRFHSVVEVGQGPSKDFAF
jgi:hypothetical protein